MREALTHIIKSIVDNPDQVEVNAEELDGGQNLIVKVAKEDMGKIIGKEGKVIREIPLLKWKFQSLLFSPKCLRAPSSYQ